MDIHRQCNGSLLYALVFLLGSADQKSSLVYAFERDHHNAAMAISSLASISVAKPRENSEKFDSLQSTSLVDRGQELQHRVWMPGKFAQFNIDETFKSFKNAKNEIDKKGVEQAIKALESHCDVEFPKLLREDLESRKVDMDLESFTSFMQSAKESIENLQLQKLLTKGDIKPIFHFFANQHGKIDQEGKSKIFNMITTFLSVPDALASKLKEENELDLQSFKVLLFELLRSLANTNIEQQIESSFAQLVDAESKLCPNKVDWYMNFVLPTYLRPEAQELVRKSGTKITSEEFKVLLWPIVRQIFLGSMLEQTIKEKTLKENTFNILASLYPTDDQGRLIWNFPDGVDWKAEFSLALGYVLTKGLGEQFQVHAGGKQVDDAALLSVLTASDGPVRSLVANFA